MRQILTLVILALLVVSIGGCASADAAPQPPTIRYGVDVSDECGMIIDDPRFAVAALPTHGDPLLFDDLGDFLSYHQSRQPSLRAVFVHDFQTREWILADQAWHVASPKIITPMDAGLASFADESTAQAEAARLEGQVLDWPAVLARVSGHRTH